jgi:hypothetical protein
MSLDLSALDRSYGNSFHKEALETQEHNHDREGDHGRRRHEQLEFKAVFRSEKLKAYGNGIYFFFMQIDKGHEKVVPRSDGGKYCNHRDNGPHDGKDQFDEYLKFIGPVYDPRVGNPWEYP